MRQAARSKPRITREAKSALSERTRACKVSKSVSSNVTCTVHQNYRVHRCLRHARRNYEDHLANLAPQQSKTFFAHIKNSTNLRNPSTALRTEDEVHTIGP